MARKNRTVPELCRSISENAKYNLAPELPIAVLIPEVEALLAGTQELYAVLQAQAAAQALTEVIPEAGSLELFRRWDEDSPKAARLRMLSGEVLDLDGYEASQAPSGKAIVRAERALLRIHAQGGDELLGSVCRRSHHDDDDEGGEAFLLPIAATA